MYVHVHCTLSFYSTNLNDLELRGRRKTQSLTVTLHVLLSLPQSRVKGAKQQLMGVVRENTQQLTKLHSLLTSQDDLETRLNSKKTSLVSNSPPACNKFNVQCNTYRALCIHQP